jgi:CheY-like chemotaxis protein
VPCVAAATLRHSVVAATGAAGTAVPLRVLLVDDVEDIRFLLRVQFQMDGRFDVVGEGGDGLEAIELSEALQPDVVVLDRQMPRLGGLEAIAGIRRVAPHAAIVLYTAATDEATYHAAVAAGALDVLSKTAGPGFIDGFTEKLLGRGGGEDDLEVRVGPVPAAAARVWIANTKTILAAIRTHPEIVEVPADVIDLFESLLARWDETAAGARDFLWVARADAGEVSRIVEHWAVIDSLTDEQLERLGVHWSPPAGRVFFDALTTGVLRALERHGATRRLAARLAAQWAS